MGIGVIELVILAVVGLFLFRKTSKLLRAAKSGLSASVSRLPRPVGTVAAIAWCWLAPTCIMAVFVALNGGPLPHWDRIVNSVMSDEPFLRRSRVNHVLVSGPAELPESSDLAGNRPKWTEDQDKTSGDIRRIVLTSQIWSTEEEANEELSARTAALLQSDFKSRHDGLFDPDVDRFLSVVRAVELAVKEKYVERFDQNFGSFTSPMNRVWWQVELSPVVRTEIYPAWKLAVVQNRIIALGTILAIVTLLANTYAMFGRLKQASRGTVRAALVTTSSLALWIAADVFVASRLMS